MKKIIQKILSKKVYTAYVLKMWLYGVFIMAIIVSVIWLDITFILK